MKKIFALMSGETILEKSEHRNLLVQKRDEMHDKNVDVFTFLGAVQIDEFGKIGSTKIIEAENDTD